jgi:hypothetical protein
MRVSHASAFGVIRGDLTYPKSLHHLRLVDAEFLSIFDSELSDSESPAVQTGTESDSTLVWVDLDVTKSLVEVSGDYDVDGFDGPRERLIEILLPNLKLKKGTIDLVDNDDRLDTLTKGLTENCFGLDTDTFDTVDDDKSAISDSKSSCDLRGEIDVTRRIDQVDQELVSINLLWDIFQIFLIRQVRVQRDGGRLNGDASILFILTGVCESSFTSLCGRDDTSALDQGVGEGRFAVIDVSNDGHVARDILELSMLLNQ